ncbi:hypothetical protein I350_05834 [Cryptococcus amylolentus CBS 6273]|uniref:Glycosyltransferase family 31 protein n=1 Tax=Cryptococcus amylolentus CBS 6273 TaxID=1296118 RepID=A0A1E3JQ38_9TREE|nr:hypothetical protein I350_05834 [Cryptococcus amylolentus CBS 6273]
MSTPTAQKDSPAPAPAPAPVSSTVPSAPAPAGPSAPSLPPSSSQPAHRPRPPRASSHRTPITINTAIPAPSTRTHPLKRLSIDLSDQSYSHSTSTDAYTPITPTQENGHLGITRRRQSVSSPRAKSNSVEIPQGKVRSPGTSSGFSWLSGGRLGIPHTEDKGSKSDDEREEDDIDTPNWKRQAKKGPIHHKWDWGMPTQMANPAVDVTPTTPVEGDQPTPLVQPTNLASSSHSHSSAGSIPNPLLQPLPQDPNNILPLSVGSSPFASPVASRASSPHRIQDFASMSSGGILPGPSSAPGPFTSVSGSSPRTSISTSSSRIINGRSNSRSSAEDDELSPPYGRYNPQVWFTRSQAPVSPKAPSIAPRIMRLPSTARLLPTGTRRWGWLLEWAGFGAPPDSPRTSGARRSEREHLMGGGGMHTGKRGTKKVLGSKWIARAMVFIPTSLWSISLFLVALAIFAVTLTMTLKHILNPDKEALPWRQYCTSSYPTLYSLQDPSQKPISVSPDHASHSHPIPTNSFASSSTKLTLTPLTPSHPTWPYRPYASLPYSYETAQGQLDSLLAPVGVLLGVFTTDAGLERRQMIRQSYGSHWRSRREGTEGVRVRFVMGRPRKRYEKAVHLEMEAFNDIVILDIEENMNSGKTHAFFSWAAENATVPDWQYPHHPREKDIDDGESDAERERGGKANAPIWMGEKRPDYVVKADDDAFIMLGELEKRLRVTPRSKAFWGYLVKNQFMAGECYALTYDLVQYIAASPALKTLTRGKEDKLVAKWMNMHPQREEIVWVTDRCWIYDHPKAGTVYSHGFLYPSVVSEVRTENRTGLSPVVLAHRGGPDAADAYSTVSKFGVAYRPFADDMSATEQVEALVEGSPLSRLREESHTSSKHSSQQAYSKTESTRHKIDRLYKAKPSRVERFLGDQDERGGTVVVHYIKKADWFVETMVALLGTADEQDVWHRGVGVGLSALERRKGRVAKPKSEGERKVQVGKSPEGL